MKKLWSLERCVESLDKLYARKGTVGIGEELIGINNLRDEKDILKFVSKYKKYSKNMHSKMIENGAKKICKLVEAGHSIDKITEFYMQDAFYFSLGHICNSKALTPWYNALDKKWSNKDRKDFALMYNIIRQ